ncbi:RDD family protein [Dyella choica]|uniref:RDD family protein n=1 Tax=Dyella choica TaxID=1927959 RepID=A0A3S0WW07_9GAMM|nr:RDD family protein [Dyella choica]RUL75956.1 RDD family protein [Dyella choica]
MDALQENGQLNELPTLTIAKFWPRLGALFIDLLIVGAVGYVLGIFLFDTLARLGVYARIVGFVIAVSYFGILHSRIGNGQTLAKRWLGLRVVDGRGLCLSLPRSLLRYTVLGLPFFLNYLPVDFGVTALSIETLISIILFGGMLSIFYLYLFNRRTRQSLHDLIVGTYVVNVNPPGLRIPSVTLWRGHLLVVGLIALFALVMPSLATIITRHPSFQPILEVQQRLQQQPHVRNAGFMEGETVVYSNTGNRTIGYLQAELTLDAPMTSDPDVAKAAARIIRTAYPEKSQRVPIVVRLVYGYNMIIAARWNSQAYRYEPGELP